MARKSLKISASDEQIQNLYNAIRSGSPISLALQFAKISLATYYYWVSIYSIVVAVKDQEELEKIESAAKSGVSIDTVRSMAISEQNKKKSAVGAFVEPSQASILQYKTSRAFKKFADQCYEIVSKCNQARSEFALLHLQKITKSTTDKKINASGSMWFLERNFPDYFAKPSDKVKDQTLEPMNVEPIQVEFIDANTNDMQQRLLDMEKEILNDANGKRD